MVQGLAFLSKKGFNPQNQTNRKQVWEAQQHSKLEKERTRRREEQLRREREDEELCAARHNGDGSQAQLRFMYDAPPGLKKEDGKTDEAVIEKSNENKSDITQIQPGDDAAAAAFRRMLAVTSSGGQARNKSNDASQGEGEEVTIPGFTPVLQGSTMEQDFKNTDTRSALEKAVGRKDRGSTLTLEEQIQRFPQLKNAPMAKGMSTTDVNVSFKPLGAELRNVKCLACGVWGHSRGDRECQISGWDPFSSTGGVALSTIRPSKEEGKKERDRRSREDHENDSHSSSSSSSSSSDDRRRRREKKHRKRKKESSSRKRSRKHRSRDSSSSERKRHKSSRKSQSKDRR